MQTGVYNKLTYDIRGELSQVRVGTTPNDGGYNRGALIFHHSNMVWGGSDSVNNGNLKKEDIYIPDSDLNQNPTLLTQYFGYDALNRLASVSETNNVSAGTDSQNFSYDRYGNRQISSATGGVNNASLSFDASTNRLTSINSITQTFDSSGNMTGNSAVAWSYDAENHLTRDYQTGNPGNQYGIYAYDGDGHRTKRWNATDGEVWQVYGVDGEIVAEYNANASAASPNKEYGYSNGRLLITADSSSNINWLVADHLGTSRMVIDKTGNLSNVKRHDYFPFGEEVGAGGGGRTTSQGYGQADNVRQHFTGYERDIEADLDFAQARMYNFRHGRFTAVDPLLVSADPTNPQTWNRYIYCLNNPLVLIDPSGEITGDYYDKEGKWLFTDNINDDKVYLATPTTTAEGATNYEVQELAITHTQFKIISNIVKQEGATDDTNEYLWIAHASNNEAQATNKSLYGLLMSSFSSVPNRTGLSTKDGSLRANAARAGVIDVLSGGADPTSGARRWDGTDFLAWGERQNKFKEFGSILIREDIFNSYLSSQGSYYPYRGTRYPIPADVFNRNKNPNNWGNWNRDGVSEYGFKYVTNREKILYATGTAGKSIFWTINYKWVK